MDDIPLFYPARTQAWRAYHCRKKLMLISLISDKDFAKIFTELLGNMSAMELAWMTFPSSVLVVRTRGGLTTISNIIIMIWELGTQAVTVTVTCHI
jgi:urease accessory protein UreH